LLFGNLLGASLLLLLYLGGEEPHVVQICEFSLAAIDGKILKTWLAHFGPFALMAESMAFAFIDTFDHNLHFDVILNLHILTIILIIWDQETQDAVVKSYDSREAAEISA